METKTLDLRGLKCPEPLKGVQAELEVIKEGVLIALLESPARWNVERYARKSGLRVEGKKIDGYYELKIIKSAGSRPKKENLLRRLMNTISQEEPAAGLKDMMLVVTRDVLGGEEDIGKVLMKAFFETMKVMDDIPAAILFMNSGVRLTSSNDDIVSLLKDFELRGTEIFSCSTCLKHFGLEDSLRVGQAGGMAVLTEGMRNFKKIMTI